MATKKSAKRVATKTEKADRSKAETTAKFPYTTKPGSLRRLLKEIPRKPRPPKFDMTLLKGWGFSDQNDNSMLRVLKAVNLLNDKNEPTELYGRFMSLEDGAKVLGPEIRKVYAPLFQASHTPYTEGNEKLKNLFNIHSGGGTRTIDHQIQTLKALCENATFDQTDDGAMVSDGRYEHSGGTGGQNTANDQSKPVVNINLHIHLPENKMRRDYEDIIEDIGRHIFGRNTGDRRG